MANPQLIPGNLNRVRGSITVTNHLELNVSASFLGRDAITIAPEGDVTTTIQLLTSTAQSPEPYQLVTVTANIVKSMALSQLYMDRMQRDSNLGQLVITLDTNVLVPITVLNASITNWSQLDSSGEKGDFAVSMRGYMELNSSMWNA